MIWVVFKTQNVHRKILAKNGIPSSWRMMMMMIATILDGISNSSRSTSGSDHRFRPAGESRSPRALAPHTVWDQRGFFGIMALATLGSMELTLRDIENGTFSRLIYLLKMVMFYSYVNDCKRLPEGTRYPSIQKTSSFGGQESKFGLQKVFGAHPRASPWCRCFGHSGPKIWKAPFRYHKGGRVTSFSCSRRAELAFWCLNRFFPRLCWLTRSHLRLILLPTPISSGFKSTSPTELDL